MPFPTIFSNPWEESLHQFFQNNCTKWIFTILLYAVKYLRNRISERIYLVFVQCLCSQVTKCSARDSWTKPHLLFWADLVPLEFFAEFYQFRAISFCVLYKWKTRNPKCKNWTFQAFGHFWVLETRQGK